MRSGRLPRRWGERKTRPRNFAFSRAFCASHNPSPKLETTSSLCLFTFPFLHCPHRLFTGRYFFPCDRRCGSWSLHASETGESTKCWWVGVVEGWREKITERSRWRPVELNERHLRSHGKIGDFERTVYCCQKFNFFPVRVNHLPENVTADLE